MKTQPNQDAFSHSASWNHNGEEYDSGSSGLTKREYFACHILAGRMAHGVESATLREVCNSCVNAADALIAALNKEPTP